MSNDEDERSSTSDSTLSAETECHRLVRIGDWDSLVERLRTEEGREEAQTTDAEERLIFHLENAFRAPLHVLRAMHDANVNGWDSPLQRYDEGPITFPIFLAVGRTSQENLAYILQKHPNTAQQREYPKRILPLHKACRAGDDIAVKELLAAYPAGAAVKSNRQHFPFVEGLYQLKADTLLTLLTSFPDAAREQTKKGFLPLHLALDYGLNEQLIRSIFHSYPEACRTPGYRGRLPLHSACDFTGPYGVVSYETFQLVLQEYPDAAKVRDGKGRLALHLLCQYSYDNGNKIKFMEEILKIYPEGSAIQDHDGCLPIDLLVKGEWEVCEEFVEEAWVKLARLSPHGLLPRQGRNGPLISLARLMSPSAKVWETTALCCPRALYEIDSSHGSALEIELSDKNIDWNDSSLIVKNALTTTFQCLRLAFGGWLRNPVISDPVPTMHKLIYCSHLFLDPNDLPLLTINELDRPTISEKMTEQDSMGNNPLHVACCAPCPFDKDQMCHHSSISVIMHVLETLPENDRHNSAMARNFKGELPLHRLLKNEHACPISFLTDISSLLEVDVEMASLWDPTERLYPFMISSAYTHNDRTGKGKYRHTISVSATLQLVKAFVGRHNLTRFAPPPNKRSYDKAFEISVSPKRLRIDSSSQSSDEASDCSSRL